MNQQWTGKAAQEVRQAKKPKAVSRLRAPGPQKSSRPSYGIYAATPTEIEGLEGYIVELHSSHLVDNSADEDGRLRLATVIRDFLVDKSFTLW